MSQRTLPDLAGAAANEGEMLTIAEALRAEGLPTGDLADGDTAFFAFREPGGGLIGFAGLQQRGRAALLRSLVVLPPARARACGSAIVRWMEAEARRRGVDALYLLTTGAGGFFEKLGFRRLQRQAAPPAIAATAEFASLCPSSAVLMERKLDASSRPEGEA